MNDEDEYVPDSEEPEIVDQEETVQETQPRVVPLEALEAERRKRQDLEAQNRALQDMMVKSKAPEPIDDDDDDEEFMTRAEFKNSLAKAKFENKREVLESAYCDAKPEAVEQINKHLEGIIKRKPWLAESIEKAPNRYARAYEIVQDFMPKEEAPVSKFSKPQTEAKKIVENSQKPGNPATISKSGNMSNAEYLRSIAGKPEFKEYRKKMLSGG